MSQQWICAEGVWIPKEEDSKKINQFRMISLLNTEGKILFSIVSRRLGGFLSSNNYIDTLVQKGDAAHPGSKREQGRPCSPVVRPSQCIWLLPRQAGPDHHEQTPCVSLRQRWYIWSHKKLLKSIAEASSKGISTAMCATPPALLLLSRQESSPEQDRRRGHWGSWQLPGLAA